jgi:thymidylate synthase
MSNIENQYHNILKKLVLHGSEKEDRTGTGTLSYFGEQIRHNMEDGFPLLTTKKMAIKTMMTELKWFLKGDTNIKYLVDNGCSIWNGDAYKNYEKYAMANSYGVDILSMDEFINEIKTNDEFARKWGELGPIYGNQWKEWGSHYEYNNITQIRSRRKPGIDQIQNLINDLKNNPDSRRLMVSAWNVGELDNMVLPPCHYGFQVYTRELTLDERLKYWTDSLGKSTHYASDFGHSKLDSLKVPRRTISLMWNQRSVDTFLGLPFNIASYALLLEIIAKEVNMVPDELIGNLGDVHLYSNHIEQAKEQMRRESFELPNVIINDEFWNPNWGLLEQIDYIQVDDFQLENYQSHPSIKAPLSN